MSATIQGINRLEDDALVIFTEWWNGYPEAVDWENFCRDFTRAIIIDTLKWAAEYMRGSGPTIAAILLEESARDLEIAARNS